MKRVFDVVVAGISLIVLLPVLVVIAARIASSSGRPILFRQLRVGRNGREFTLLKFRSMSVLQGVEQGAFDAGNTSRVTDIGRILRRTKLDELPQLWNVLVGDMSLVGPRPEVRKWVEVYPERWAMVHGVRPGITDPASIEFRHEEQVLTRAADPEAMYRNEILTRKLDLYESYVRSQTFWGDMKILVRTIQALFS